MTFYEIKQGDTVFAKRHAKYGFRSAMAYMVPVVVEKVTPTQIVVDGKRFCKRYGREVKRNSYECIYLEGVDQTSEMEAFISKLELTDRLSKALDLVNVNIKLSDVGKMEELLAAIQKFNTNE
jgi:hypothetical protein